MTSLAREKPKSGRPGRTRGTRPEQRPKTGGARRPAGKQVHPAAITKTCTRCGWERGYLAFSPDGAGGRLDECRDCRPEVR